MEAAKDLELTIRTATLIKSLSTLVGEHSAPVAKMIFAQSVDQFAALGKFIDSCQPKGSQRTSTAERS